MEEPPKPTEADREAKRALRKSKEEKASRKKDDKSLDQVLKALSNLSNPPEKFEALCKKYGELVDEHKRQQLAAKVAEKRVVGLQREKEQLQGEQTKSMLSRNRLELLCRELQRQNKLMKEESLQRIREEEERRKEVSAKFHATLAEITALMQQNSESNSKLRDENLEMQNQFKGVCEQYSLREQQVEKISQQMKLEGQLADAKLAKARLELQAQKELLERDKAELMAEVALCQRKCLDHEKTEEALRAQINVYFEKYDEFQNVLTKSNQVYSGFKSEMEKMSKKITRLEKETASWKQKWESSHKALLKLAAENQMKDAEAALQTRQLAQLQKLCRTIQADRSALLQQLSSAGLTPKLKSEGGVQDPAAVDRILDAVGASDATVVSAATSNVPQTESNGEVQKSTLENTPEEEHTQNNIESSPSQNAAPAWEGSAELETIVAHSESLESEKLDFAEKMQETMKAVSSAIKQDGAPKEVPSQSLACNMPTSDKQKGSGEPLATSSAQVASNTPTPVEKGDDPLSVEAIEQVSPAVGVHGLPPTVRDELVPAVDKNDQPFSITQENLSPVDKNESNLSDQPASPLTDQIGDPPVLGQEGLFPTVPAVLKSESESVSPSIAVDSSPRLPETSTPKEQVGLTPNETKPKTSPDKKKKVDSPISKVEEPCEGRKKAETSPGQQPKKTAEKQPQLPETSALKEEVVLTPNETKPKTSSDKEKKVDASIAEIENVVEPCEDRKKGETSPGQQPKKTAGKHPLLPDTSSESKFQTSQDEEKKVDAPFAEIEDVEEPCEDSKKPETSPGQPKKTVGKGGQAAPPSDQKKKDGGRRRKK